MPQPRVVIVEEPAPAELRFRYEREGRSVGSIPGVNSIAQNKTYPTIRIENFTGNAIIVVSCVTMDWPFRPHPHSIVGRLGCKDGVCTIRVKVTENVNEYQFKHLGIQCVKHNEKDISESLATRERLGFDPFGTGFDHRQNWRNIKLKAVRLAFQVFVEPNGCQRMVQLKPAVSDIVYDKKAVSILSIIRVSHCSGPVSGGTVMTLLCEKVKREDTAVVFCQEDGRGNVLWEAYANIVLVHKLVAIVFETPPYNPPYYDPNSYRGQIIVNIQLKRISDNERSSSILFEYIPNFQELPPKPLGAIPRKRKTMMSCLQSDDTESEAGPSRPETQVQGAAARLPLEPTLGPHADPFSDASNHGSPLDPGRRSHHTQFSEVVDHGAPHALYQEPVGAWDAQYAPQQQALARGRAGGGLGHLPLASPQNTDLQSPLGPSTSFGLTHHMHQMQPPTPSQVVQPTTNDDLLSLLDMEPEAVVDYDLSAISLEDCENLSERLRHMFSKDQ